MKKCDIVFDNPNKNNNLLINEFAYALAESMAKLEEKYVFVYDNKVETFENSGVDFRNKTKL